MGNLIEIEGGGFVEIIVLREDEGLTALAKRVL